MPLRESRLARRVRQSDLRRPAIKAYRLCDRAIPAGKTPPIVVNSLPKSGTHLVTSLLDHVPGVRNSGRFVQLLPKDYEDPERIVPEVRHHLSRLKPGRYLSTHLPAFPSLVEAVATGDRRVVTILRDPRAVAVSAVNYLIATPRLGRRDEILARFPTDVDLLRALVHGELGDIDGVQHPDLATMYQRYAAWQDAGGLVVRFEDLVGPRGGGDTDVQLATVERILDHLGVPDAPTIARRVQARVFSTESATFRSGRVEGWRDELPPDLAAEILAGCEEPMRRLGYLP